MQTTTTKLSYLVLQVIPFSLLSGLLIACNQLPFSQTTPAVTSQPSVQAETATPTPSPNPNSQLSNEIDRLVTKTLVDQGPGVAVLVLQDNQPIHAKGYGFANVKTAQPITPNTNFDLASVSKQMTAIAILKLVEAGKIDLNAPVQQYIPEFRDRNKRITITHLLQHTSGLADYTSGDWDGSDAEFAQLDTEEHLKWLNRQKPRRQSGKKFEYNNSGYVLLALVVERISGQPFWQYVDQKIFAPLSMSNTQILHALDQTIPNRALGYRLNQNGKIKRSEVLTVIAGDGNVFSSIADLTKYDTALRTGRLISPQLVKQAFTPGQLNNGQPIDDDGEAYGMGWYIVPDASYVHHSGSWYGTSTYYRHYLTPSITIIILSNVSDYDGTELADAIAEAMKLEEERT